MYKRLYYRIVAFIVEWKMWLEKLNESAFKKRIVLPTKYYSVRIV